jgi:hypothetical protein
MADTVPTYDFVWQQGEDGEINMVYKINNLVVDLTGYKVRMDLKASGSGTVLFTLNSAGADTGGETTSGVEATLNTVGEIHMIVPRTASLSGGPLFNHLNTALNYDIFLRDASNKQRKILTGTITIQKSVTLWN